MRIHRLFCAAGALLILTIAASLNPLRAQVSGYTFAQSSGTYVPINTGNVLAYGTNADPFGVDDASYTAALPFAFSFNGNTYASGTNIYVHSNGFISFGNATIVGTPYTPIANNTASGGIVSPFGTDLCTNNFQFNATRTSGSPTLTAVPAAAFAYLAVGQHVQRGGIAAGTRIIALNAAAQTVTMSANASNSGTAQAVQVYGNIQWATTGTSPNRTFIIQWLNMVPYDYQAANVGVNYQIQLSETSNLVSMVYGPTVLATGVSTTCQVGLRGNSNADYLDRTSNSGWSSTINGSSNTATVALTTALVPASGLTFTYTPPACAAPGITAATNVTSSSATLNWSAASPAPSGGYQWEVRTSGTGGSGNTGLTVYGSTAAGVLTASTTAGTFVTGTQLSPNTTYNVYVRSNCGGGTFSGWGGPVTFTTPCVNSGIPFSEGFNAATIPTCWTQQFVTGTAAIQYVASSANPTTAPQEGARFVWWNSYSIANNRETRLVSPPITTTGTSSVDVSFYWMNENDPTYSTGAYLNEGVQVQYSLNGTTWTDVQFVARHDASLASGANQWKQKSITLPAAAGNQATIYVGLKFHSSLGKNCALDNLTMSATPSCLPPTVTAATSVTATSATLNWSASASAPTGGYEWEVRTSGAAGSGNTGLTVYGSTAAGVLTAGTASGTFVTGTQLLPNTTYSVYVRSNCGGTFSTWGGPVTFTTPCVNSGIPLSEGFNAATIPTCWTQQFVTGTSAIQYVASSLYPTTTPQEGSHYVLWNSFSYANNQETRLVSPPITTTGTSSVDVSFYWMNENEPDYSTGAYLNEGVQVQYSLNGTTWTNVQFVPRHDASLAAYANQWKQKTITLPAAAGNKPTVYVGLKFHSSYGENCALDNLMISATPSCLAPVVTAPTGVTATSATLNWNASASAPASGYEWEVRTSGAAGSGATGLTASGTTAAGVLTATTGNVLTANTAYSIYVRSNCDAGNFSAWSAVSTFTTPCNSATPPYTENFDGVTAPAIPSCSAVQDVNGDATTWFTMDDSAVPGHSSPNSLTYEYNFDGTTAANDWWFTQGLNLTGGTVYQISFKYASGASFYTEGLAVKAGTSPTAAGMTGAALFSNTAITNENYQNALFYYTPATGGVYYFGWHAISAADQLYLLVDDISVKVGTAPTCLAGPAFPANGGTTCQNTDGNILRWPASSDANGYDVYLDMGGAATTLVSSNQADTFYITPAMLATGSYTWRVVPRNPVGAATGCADWTFTVDPAPAITVTPSAPAICPPATSINLAADGAVSYSWSPAYGLNNTNTANVVATPAKSTSYTVTGIGSNGCKTSVNVPVSVGPVINAPISATPATLCQGSTSQLLVNPAATAQTYSMAAIAPSFYSMTGGTTITTWTDGTDDGFFAATIPFTFRFFGNNYTTLRIGTNGYMTFNGAGQAVEYLPQAMPDATTPNNLIAAVWTDLVQEGTAVTRTRTVGTTPNRVFIVDYSNVPTLDGDSTISAQVQLYEKTNKIEIHIAHAGISNTFDGATVGIEGTATGGIKGFSPGGRSLFTTNITRPEAYRFTPDTVIYAWTPAASLSNPAIKNPVATPPTGTTTYTAVLTEPGTGCATIKTVDVTARPNGYWLGAVSNDWTNGANWCGGVPSATSDVIIPDAASVPTAPVILFNTTGSAHDIQLENNSVLTIDGGGALNLYGSVNTSGTATFDATAGTVNFTGSAAQTIMPDFIVANMQIGGGGTKTLAGNVTINGELNFQDGMLDVGSNTLTLTNNASIGNANATRYVKTGPGGRLARNVGAFAVEFPVGSATYNPATLSNDGAADAFSVGVRDQVQQEGNSGGQIDPATTYAVNHTWDIEEAQPGGSDVTLTLQWGAGETNSPSFDYSHVYISHYGGSSWDNPYTYAFLAPAADGSGPFTATRTGITSFSPFAIGSAGGSSPLPVTLVRLDASNQGSRNKVEWESATEHDLKSYIVERSTDGKRFAQMDEITAAGKAQGYITYDNQPAQGFTYYRLKMVDYSGAFVHSQTVKAFMGRAGEVVLTAAPNPLRDVLTVSVYGAQDGQAQLTDVSGRVVASAAMQAGQATFNTSALAAGTYFVKWSNGVASQTIKVTRQ